MVTVPPELLRKPSRLTQVLLGRRRVFPSTGHDCQQQEKSTPCRNDVTSVCSTRQQLFGLRGGRFRVNQMAITQQSARNLIARASDQAIPIGLPRKSQASVGGDP